MACTTRDCTSRPVRGQLCPGKRGLEPLDLVLMTGNTIGDRSSELERFLIRAYREKQSVPDEVVTYVAPLSDPVDAAKSLVFDFSDADRVPPEKFNRILWKGLMNGKPFPALKGRRDADDRDD